MNITAREKEWNRLLKQERCFVAEGLTKKDSRLNRLLQDKVPDKLQSTLDSAFAKAFETIFDKGTGIIEKTYNKDKIEKQFQVNSYAQDLSENRKTLRKFAKDSDSSKAKNLLLTGVEGIGLGALGVGLPDIPLFVGVLLKSIYEIAMNFGYSYDTPEEKYFILKLIEISLSYGWDLRDGNDELNRFIEEPCIPEDFDLTEQIRRSSCTMSTELLYLKFLQGIPVVGAVGGAYNTVYLQKVLKYAKLKYHRRFLTDKDKNDDPGNDFDPAG